jgi:MFS family permease
MTWAWLGGGWADRVPRRRLIVVGWAVYALSYALLAVATEAWQAWALLVLYGAFAGLTEPAEKALVKELAPKELHGRAFGLYHAVLGAMAIPAGLLTGALWQAFGAGVALGSGAVIAGLCAVALATKGRSSAQVA